MSNRGIDSSNYVKTKKALVSVSKQSCESIERDEKENKHISLFYKYQPTELEDILEQKFLKQTFLQYINNGNIINSIIYGPSGTGKNLALNILIKKIYGVDAGKMTKRKNSKYHVLYMDASSDRGIRVMRDKIKEFTVMNMFKSNSNENQQRIRTHLVVMDEADYLTGDTQYALRRIMEDSSQTTRYILICNHLDKIITPLQSRCAIISVPQLSVCNISKYLSDICEKENIYCENKILNQLILSRNCDIRQCLYAIDYVISSHNSHDISGNNLSRSNTQLNISNNIWNNFLNKKTLGKQNSIQDNLISDTIDWKEEIQKDPHELYEVIVDWIHNGKKSIDILNDLAKWIFYIPHYYPKTAKKKIEFTKNRQLIMEDLMLAVLNLTMYVDVITAVAMGVIGVRCQINVCN